MTLRIANRVFVPRPWAVLATAALLAAFFWLGWWQLGRAREKEELIDSFQRGANTSVTLGTAGVDALPRYQHVAAQGQYDPSRQILLDNMPSSAGKAGYRVLTPLRLRSDGARVLMVDRGWVPLGSTRADLPVVAVSSAERVVQGRLDALPVPGVRVGAAGVASDTQWPRVLNFPQRADVEQALRARVEPQILLLDPSQPDGYERASRPSMDLGPERHLGYAVQWWSLAIVVMVLFISLNLRRETHEQA